MPIKRFDKTEQLAVGVGTAALTFTTATSGNRTYAAAGAQEGDQFWARIQHERLAAEWEICLVTIVGGTIVRSTPEASGTGAAVAFSAGNKIVSDGVPFRRMPTADNDALAGADTAADDLFPVWDASAKAWKRLTRVEWAAAMAAQQAEVHLTVDFLAQTNLLLPSPTLTDGALVVGGVTIADGQTGLLMGQTDPVDNGVYQWSATDETLTRAGVMSDGLLVLAPVTVAVGTLEDEELSDTTWGLQETSFTVGTAPNTWAQVIIEDPNALRANQWPMGNRVMTVSERSPVVRSMEATDLPRYRDWLDNYSPFSRSMARRMHYVGYASDTLDMVRPLIQQDWLLAKIKHFDTFVFDQSVFVANEIKLEGLRGKRLVFMGNGWKGPNRAYLRGTSSFLNIGGSEGISLTGDCVIERMHDRTGSAIRATADFSDLRSDRILSRNSNVAIAFGAYAGNYDFGAVKTCDPVNEALMTGSTATGLVRELMEGTFIPTFAFATPGTSSFSYSSQIGEYQKFGSWVQVAALVTAVVTTGTGSGDLRISAPFTASSGLFTLPGATSNVDTDITWPASSTMVTPRINAGANYVTLGVMKSANSDANIGAAHFSTGATISLRYNIRYKA